MNATSHPVDGLRSALLLHQQGRVTDAEAACRKILKAQPNHAGALHLLGVVALQQGRLGGAVELLRHSLTFDPNQPFANLNLGAALLGLGQPADALACFERAILLVPRSVDALYNRGTALLQLERPLEALASFERVLELNPYHLATLNNRGSALKALGRFAEALETYDSALRLSPDVAETLNNRANVLEALDRHAEALESYDRALGLRPQFPQALSGRGSVLRVLGRFDEALASYDSALRLRNEFPEALTGRGRVLQKLQRLEEALGSFDSALRLKPDLPTALNYRGNTLCTLGRSREALASFEAALQLRPEFPEALCSLGVALQDLGRAQEALSCYDRALRINPDYPEALMARGNALQSLQRYEEALGAYDAALRIKPDYAIAYNNRGSVLRGLRRYDEAIASFARSFELGEVRPDALGNYGWTLLEMLRYEDAVDVFARILALKPDFPYGLGGLLFSRINLCDWSEYHETVGKILAGVQAGKPVIAPFTLLAVSDEPRINARGARLTVAQHYPAPPAPAWSGRRYQHERIRIGYLSPDFRDHVVSYLLTPLIERHDRTKFELFAISVRPPDSTPAGRRISAAFDHFHDVSSMTDDQAAALMCDLEIDVAVDLAGLTGEMRTGILARRAAPVQVNYLGCPGTMGADFYDYLVADRRIIPEEARGSYAEKIVYLPDCYQVNHSQRPTPPESLTRSDCGLPEQALVFCSFNNNFKITPQVFDVWMRILGKIPGSVLWLAAHRETTRTNLRSAAQERGIAAERLIFAGHKAVLDDHLVRYSLADLFLDTFPFNAHATASDALWYGVPVVTCEGKAFAGRVAASLLHAMGVSDLVTGSLGAYEEKILELATHRGLREDIRARLLRNRATHPPFDTERFRMQLESAYTVMWERSQRGEPPGHFAVDPSQILRAL